MPETHKNCAFRAFSFCKKVEENAKRSKVFYEKLLEFINIYVIIKENMVKTDFWRRIMNFWSDIWARICSFFTQYVAEPIVNMNARDIIDVLLLALVLYELFRFAQNRRAGRVTIGLLIVIFVFHHRLQCLSALTLVRFLLLVRF